MKTISFLSNSQNGLDAICLHSMKPMDFDERIRHNLRRLIKHYDNGNQSAFARRFGLKPSFVNGVLNGKRAIGKGIIELICNKLKVDISELTMPEEPKWAATVHEERAIYSSREGEKLGIINQIEAVTQAMIDQAKKNTGPGIEGKAGGLPRSRNKQRAG